MQRHPTNLRILQICTSDINGGAARAAYRLQQGLVRQGADCHMLVASKATADDNVLVASIDRSPLGIARRKWVDLIVSRQIASHASDIAKGYELFTTDDVADRNRLPRSIPPCDLVHLHWLTWFIDYPTFFARLPEKVPVVWTLHDMNAFTGGCHYDAGCGRFKDKCGACPALASDREHDLSRRIYNRKWEVFSRLSSNRIHFVLPSRWLESQLKASSLLSRFPRSVIPYGLDTGVFRPIDRSACRQVLGIPLDAKLVLFVADSIENQRKGFGLLIKALESLSDVPGIYLLSIGKPSRHTIAGIPHLSLGMITNEALLPAIYNAADTLVIPSLQDNLPNTVLEAIACGTPCVGFDAGGIPDMIRPGQTGLLAPVGDVGKLASRLREILHDPDAVALSASCREVAVREYDEKVQALRMLDLYAALTETANIPQHHAS